MYCWKTLFGLVIPKPFEQWGLEHSGSVSHEQLRQKDNRTTLSYTMIENCSQSVKDRSLVIGEGGATQWEGGKLSFTPTQKKGGGEEKI